MASNTAAYITAAKARPLEVKQASIVEPGTNQILVKNHAIAINPIDYKLQALTVYPITYPAILGQDVAGEVVSVGSDVTRFNPGDRVIGIAAGFATKKDSDKAFQHYTILETNLACHIPDNTTFERAVVLPLAITTAAAGLFQPDFLNLQLPSIETASQSEEVVLVWGGASSVGSAAVQLAKVAGYKVIATASTKNFKQVKGLGAEEVFDYKDESVVKHLLTAIGESTLAGIFDAVGGAAWAPCTEVASRARGSKFIATAVARFPDPPEGISMKQVFSLSVMTNHVGKAIWEDFLPAALKAGSMIPFPEPVVAGHGLESIQTGIDLLGRGVSAQKVVVTL